MASRSDVPIEGTKDSQRQLGLSIHSILDVLISQCPSEDAGVDETFSSRGGWIEL